MTTPALRDNPIQASANYTTWRQQADLGSKASAKGDRMDFNYSLAAADNSATRENVRSILNSTTTEPQAVFAVLYHAPVLKIRNKVYTGDAGDFTAQGIADNFIANGAICAALQLSLNNIGFDITCA